jgi:hypothetical protein
MENSNTAKGSTFNQFSSNNKYTSNSAKEFFESNSLVAKIAFLLLVLFGFVVLLRLGITILSFFLQPTESPILVDGMVDAKQLIIITQDPSEDGAITIQRSTNASDGIEFTWSCWIYIDDLTYNSGKYRCVFYKGNEYATDRKTEEQPKGLNFPNNSPGLYIAPNTNALVIIMNTFKVINEEIIIDDIPLNKWVNVIIRCQNTTLDVYINGTITKSHLLHGVPKQNYGDVYIAPNGGFSGNISNLRYYNYALGTTEIANIMNKGPNTKFIGSNSLNIKNNNYLSLRWFFYGESNGYNP